MKLKLDVLALRARGFTVDITDDRVKLRHPSRADPVTVVLKGDTLIFAPDRSAAQKAILVLIGEEW